MLESVAASNLDPKTCFGYFRRALSPDQRLSEFSQLDTLRRELSARQSIVHFAHAAVATLAALICTGLSFRLKVEVEDWLNMMAVPAAWAAMALLGYAIVRAIFGYRAMRSEAIKFEHLKLQMRTLGVDDPSTLLPR